jgi:hypothetical protein
MTQTQSGQCVLVQTAVVGRMSRLTSRAEKYRN